VIVLDASVVVELLINSEIGMRIRDELSQRNDSFIAPHLIDVEVISAIRRLTTHERVDAHRSKQFLTALEALPVVRYSHAPLLGRIWELRHNFTAYDATYIALAEATGADLYTCDEKLVKGHRVRVKVF
jgi:predicted nucleic acid-binding protein